MRFTVLLFVVFCSLIEPSANADSSTASPSNVKLAIGGSLLLEWDQPTDTCQDGKPYAERCPVVSWRIERMDNGKPYAPIITSELPADAREYAPDVISTPGTYCYRLAARSGGPVAASSYTYSNPRCVDVADLPSYPKAATLRITGAK